MVSKDGKYGYINAKGKVLVQPVYDYLGWSFPTDSLTYVKKDGKYGYINAKGKLVIKPVYDNVDAFHNGIAVVKKNGKWGVINTKGKFIVKAKYDFGTDVLNSGVIQMRKGDTYTYFNQNGEKIYSYSYTETDTDEW
jgi:hypothetical protein